MSNLDLEPQSSGRKILVVDDNEDIADALSRLLSLLGYEVLTAYDGVRAIEVAKKELPDIVLLDIGMPEIDGYEVARKMKNSIEKKIKLIAITGYGQEEDRTRAYESGFDYHLVKPVGVEDLKFVLQS
jgi:CheY-like chemotaxis protein